MQNKSYFNKKNKTKLIQKMQVNSPNKPENVHQKITLFIMHIVNIVISIVISTIHTVKHIYCASESEN